MSNLLKDSFFEDFDVSSSYDSEGRPLSVEQERFFNSSKCRDEDGRLLVVYHASNSEFSAFDPKYIRTRNGNIYGDGFYFNDDNFGLDIYGKYVREYYLNLNNPFVWKYMFKDADYSDNVNKFINMLKQNNFNVSKELHKKLEDDLIDEDGDIDTLIAKTCGYDSAQAYFKNAGYDGIINFSTGDIVAFEPSQIKLCTNRKPSNSVLLAV